MRTGGAFATSDAYVPESEGDALGFPLGSALEIVGPPGIGKTTWTLQMAMLERMSHILYSIDLALDDLGSQPGQSVPNWDAWLDENVVPWCAQVVLAGM